MAVRNDYQNSNPEQLSARHNPLIINNRLFNDLHKAREFSQKGAMSQNVTINANLIRSLNLRLTLA
jgi:hypothetical protein